MGMRAFINLFIAVTVLVALAVAGARADGNAPGRSAGPGRIAALIGSMHDRDPMVRQAAARSLGEAGDKAAVPALSESMSSDPDVTVRLIALGSLSMIGDKSAIPVYEKALTDVSEKVRQSAAQALSGFWGETAHSILVNALRNDPSPKVRRSVAEALGNPGIMGRYTAHKWSGTEITQAALIQSLAEDKDYGVRAVSAAMLGKFKNSKSLDPLLKTLEKDASVSVRAAAAESLGLLEMPARTVKPLLDVVYFEKDEMVVAGALKALKYSGDPRAGDAAVSVLRSPSAAVRWQAIDVIEEIRPKDAVGPLNEIAGDSYESEGVRHKAKLALQALGEM